MGDEERSRQEKRPGRGHSHHHGDAQGLRGGTTAHSTEYRLEIARQVERSTE